uniref:guanylate kinase n=1 Tax=Caenorhabditis tropicalis TaxID=1561998 RepID=A0A1I7TKD7_9PELO
MKLTPAIFTSFGIVRKMPCRPIVLSGPSGGGKSTIITRAMKEYPTSFVFSVSHTTRSPRAGEVHGKHYYFTDKEKMQEMIKNGEFLEFATFSGNTYGTSKKTVEDIENSGKICVLDIELQGVRNIKTSHLDARYILIRAPSIESLEQRLRARGTETEETLKKRLQHAQEDLVEIERNPTLFDKVIVNDDLERAYKEFVDLIREDLEKTSNR